MNRGVEIVEDTELFLQERGLTISELLLILGKYNSRVLQMDDENCKEFTELYNKIEHEKDNSLQKGKLLEDLSFILFREGYKGLLECHKNCRTSTNEIDILLRWTQQARLAGIYRSFDFFGESFLCECKNYKGKVNVTYVGKFFSLMCVTNSTMGIMIAWEGVSARNAWADAEGLIKKIALKENKYIIVLDKKDLKRIAERKDNIFSLIYNKYLCLKNDIDYSKYIEKHEAEEFLTK